MMEQGAGSAVAPARDARVDGLRGMAILGVLVLHFTLGYGLRDSPLGAWLPRWLLGGLTLNGNYGVTMFFVVSGYLITSNSLRRWGDLHRIDARTFYASRAARILPPLLVVLALIVALGCLGVPYFTNGDDNHDFPPSYFIVAAGSVLTFWHNVLMQSAGYFNYCLNVYWSLSVEEVFYIALPLLCLGTRDARVLLGAALVLVACGPMYRYTHSDNDIYYLYGYPACFDAIAMGCVTAVLARRVVLAGPRAAFLRAGAIAVMAATWIAGWGDHVVFGFTLMAFAAAVYLLASAQASPPSPRLLAASRPLRWLGRHSYEIYLTHIVVLAALRDVVDRGGLSYAARLPWLALFLALSCVAAALMARFVAEPANVAIRRRLGRGSPAAPRARPAAAE